MFLEFVQGPNSGHMIGDRGMAIKARIPAVAALELDRDDVERRVPVFTSRLAIYIDPVHFAPVNNSHE